MKLRTNEFCPIHRSTSCCGREQLSTPRLIRLGIQRVEDPHHPRGYRELRSPAEMRKLMNRKVLQQGGICAICHEEFTDYNDIVPDHKNPKGMGGYRVAGRPFGPPSPLRTGRDSFPSSGSSTSNAST